MAVTRQAEVKWSGDLMSGSGKVSAVSSGAFEGLPVTWASRTEMSNGKTSPEELIASAHASCFSMALSNELAKAGFKPESLEVTCEIAFDRIDGKWTVASSTLTVRGCVPGIDASKFSELADGAKENCPVSRAMKGNVALKVEAHLESGVTA